MQPPRGTRDFGPKEMALRRRLEDRMRRVFRSFNYGEVATPAFEELGLFLAKSGAGIREEIYDFKDKSGRDLCLRPELTAPVMRYYFSDLRMEPKPLRLFYFGPCYRYDRPQSGRYREFWQMGCELVGDESAEAHAELLHLAIRLFEAAGLERYVLRIGHLAVLRSALEALGFQEVALGPLMRLIDKKDWAGLEQQLAARGGPQAFADFKRLIEAKTVADATLLAGNPEAQKAKAHLARVLELLGGFDVDASKVRLDLTIARGLEYYTGLVFEFDAPDLGAEKQLLGGGAYDVSAVFGQPPVAAIGFALGFDRTLEAVQKTTGFQAPAEPVDALVAALSAAGVAVAQRLATVLRGRNLCVELDLSAKGAKKSIGRASALKARSVVFVGDQEVAESKATVKNLATGEQVRVTYSEVPAQLESWMRAPAR